MTASVSKKEQMKIDGREIASKILVELKKKVKKLKEKNLIPHLAVVLVGNHPSSVSYVNQKELKGKRIGAKISVKHLSSDTSQRKLLAAMEQLNNDNNIHGIIVQRPLPKNIDSNKVSMAVDPKKDVDGFRPNSKFQPPIALAVLRILTSCHSEGAKRLKNPMTITKEQGVLRYAQNDRKTISFDIRYSNFIIWLESKKIVVIGKGETGGQPVIETLKKMGVELEIIDSKTKNPESITKKADIIISAVGKPKIVKPEMLKKGVILIGVGLHKGNDGKLHGDYDEDKIKNIASFYTPTPGGVGPINVAMLLSNLITAAENSQVDTFQTKEG